MVYIGIDPGQKGGFAVLDGEKTQAEAWNNERFIEVMRSIDKPAIACVEKVGAMPKQGVTSMFHFGKSAGFIEGVLASCGIPYELITPQKWKKEFGLHSDKEESISCCKSIFPDVNLLPTPRCKKDSDGIAEALLMAVYAKRHLG